MPSLLERIDQVCEAYEDLWSSQGSAPSLEAQLSGWSGAERVALLRHLVPIDLHYRRQAGETPDWGEYAARFPELDLGLGEEEIGAVAAGVRFGDFVIEGELGRGGMGIVYVAHQTSLDRRVALKVLPSVHALSPAAIERFQREAKAAGRLQHANIVPVFEVGQIQSSFFIAMQLIEGESLDQLRRDLEHFEAGAASSSDESGPEPSVVGASRELRRQWASERGAYYRNIARLGVQIADALAFAHARGVIHRDIKPSNLLLDRAGLVWVADFGLAKMADSDLTMTGDVVGTLRYMSPERLEGECDERGDIYGAGASLYELTTGRRIHAGTRRTTLVDSIERLEPVAPRVVDPKLPLDLETIVLRAIEKKPEARYQSAEEFGDDLRRFLEDRPILARRAGLAERLSRWRRQNRAVAALLASVVGLLLLSIAGALVAATIFSRQSRDNLRLALDESAARVAADEAVRENRTTLYYAQMLLAGQAAGASGGISVVREFVEPWAQPAASGHDPRGWEWFYLNGVAHQEQHVFAQPSYLYALDWHPERPWIALAATPVLVIEAESGARVAELAETGQPVHDVCWSPDGSRLAAAGPREILVWETGSWRVLARLPCARQAAGLAWKPDGVRLAVECFNDEFLRLWDTDQDRILATTEGRGTLGIDVPHMDFSANGEWLATDGSYGVVALLAGDSLERVHDLHGHDGVINATSFAPSGLLATASFEPAIRLWDPSTGQAVGLLEGHDFRVTALAWNGDHLASGSWDYTIRLWDVAERRQTRTLKGHTRNLRDVDWSPDGRRLASCADDSRLCVWDLEAPAPLLLTDNGIGHALYSVTAAWTDTGLIVADLHGEARIRDANGELVFQESGGHISLSRDGRRRAWQTDDRVQVEHWPSRDPIGALELLRTSEPHLVFSPDGRRLAIAHEGGVGLVDLEHDMRVSWIPGFVVRDLAWRADGQLLAIAQYETVMLVGVDGQVVLERKYDSGVHDLAWGPEGRRLALACVDQTAKIVSADTLEIEREFRGHSNELRAIDWSPDGTRLATGSLDASVRVWDVASGSLALTFGLEAPGAAVAWSPDSRVLVAIDDFGRQMLWDAGPGRARAGQ